MFELFEKMPGWVIISLIIAVIVVVVVGVILCNQPKASFSPLLVTPLDQINQSSQPKNFPKLSQPGSGEINLREPDVHEEIGVAMVYPQGVGVGMSKSDSNSFQPNSPGPLLTDYTIPESYGESSLSDPTGVNGANEGSRILKIKNAGNQTNFKPMDESMNMTYAQAYSSSGQVQDGATLINNASNVTYTDDFKPEDNLRLQSSPGQENTLQNCETTYPNTVKYNNFCITEGDIPYGKVIDNKVNPRLVSRWESFTGDYSREAALEPIDGLLYPNLEIPN